MVQAHCLVLKSRYLNQYLDVYRERFKAFRRHYALLKVLKVFLENSGESDLDKLIDGFKVNGSQNLHIVVQKTVSFLQAYGKNGKPLAPKTVLQYIGLLKDFLIFCDVDVDKAWRKVKLPKKANVRRDQPIKLHELQKLIMVFKSPRMRLLIQLLAQTGLRISEALELKVADVDLDNGWVRVRGNTTKTGHEREVPIISELAESLREYLLNRKTESEYLFPNEMDPSKPVTKQHVYEAFKDALKRLKLDERDPSGIGYRIHFHALRKFFKTQLEAAGVNPLLIERWMGHNIGNIAQTYFIPSPQMIMEAKKKAEAALKIFGESKSSEQIEQMLQDYQILKNRVKELEEKYLREEALEYLIRQSFLLHQKWNILKNVPDQPLKDIVLDKISEELQQIEKRMKEIRFRFDKKEWAKLEDLAELYYDELKLKLHQNGKRP